MADVRKLLEFGSPITARALKQIDGKPLSGEFKAEMVEWAAHLRISRDLSHNTVANYLLAVVGFLLWYQERYRPLARSDAGEVVKTSEIEAWLHHLFVNEHQESATRGLKLTALRVYFSWRCSMGAVGNPAAALKLPRKKKRLPKKYSEAQLRKLFSTCNPETEIGIRDYSVLMFLYCTGGRRDELENLNLDQIELKANSGRVKFLGKGSKERAVSFGKLCTDALRMWFSVREGLGDIHDPDAVWLGVQKGPHRGKRFRRWGLYSVVRRAAKKAGLRIEGAKGVHRMRVTFATDLYDNGQDIETIRILLGHEDINTTRGYIAISEKRLKTKLPENQIRKVIGNERLLPLWARGKVTENHAGE